MGHMVTNRGISSNQISYYKINPLKRLFLFCISMLFSTSVVAASGWTITPSVDITETYTDNVRLSNAADTAGDFVTDINPGIAIERKGKRLQLNAEYGIQALFYADDSDRDEIYNNLRAALASELIENHLYFDSNATISQSLVDPSKRQSGDIYSAADRNEIYTLELAPRLEHKLGSFANVKLGYNFNAIRYKDVSESGNDIANSDNTSANFEISNSSAFSTLSWRLAYSQNDVERDGQDNISSTVGFAEARLRLNKSFNLIVNGGDEDHDFDSQNDSINSFKNGSYVAAGLGWAPNKKIAIDILSGDNSKQASIRFTPTTRTSMYVDWRDRSVGTNIGEAWKGDFQLRSKRSTWRATFTEDLTTQQEIQSGNQIDAFTGKLVFNPEPGQAVIVLPIDIFELTNEIFIRKRAELSMGYNTSKSNILMSVFKEDREFEVVGDDETAIGGSATWRLRLSSRTNLDFAVHAEKRELRSTDIEDGLWSFDVSIDRRVSRKIKASVGYQHSALLSSDNSREYDENRVTLNIGIGF